jgi:hypothetical protein
MLVAAIAAPGEILMNGTATIRPCSCGAHKDVEQFLKDAKERYGEVNDYFLAA